MRRVHQFVFVVSLLALNWLAMMAVHELGHVVGAIIAGGSIERVVLHPLEISRTDVSPNPHPAILVWLGPVLGCILPLAGFAAVPRRLKFARNIAQFFAGFCLIANGAYLFLGSIQKIGDSGEMLRAGTPHWLLLTFGAVTVPLGLYLWHRLGSPRRLFMDHPTDITPRTAYLALAALTVAVVAGMALSPR